VTFKFTELSSTSQFSFLVKTLVLRILPSAMELRSRVLAEVETGDSGPGVPVPSSLLTEGCGEPVPDSAMSHRSITEEAGTSPLHPSMAGLMGATLRDPIVGSSQMLRTIGTVVNPDVHADIEHDLALEAGTEVRPTQPPHPPLVVDVPSGYLEDLGTFGTPDMVNIEDTLSVDVTPLSSIVTSFPDVSVARSMSVNLGTSMSVDFDDRAIEIDATAATPPSSATNDNPIVGSRSFRNPSLAPNVGRASLGDTASGKRSHSRRYQFG